MLGLHSCLCSLCVGLQMSLDHPSYSQTNKCIGGLKFLLPTFKAHGRNSSVIEVRGERRESRGRAKGWTWRNAGVCLYNLYTALTCSDLDKASMISSPSFYVSMCLFVIIWPLGRMCLSVSPLDRERFCWVSTSLRSYFTPM